MEMRRLGRDGPEISIVGYGAWEAGGTEWGTQDDEQVVESMRAAFDAGINWIDTAEVYGDGHSEELVARAVGRRRDDVLIFTKVAPFGTGTRPEQVKKAIRGSLQRLETDYVDLYQIHWPDERKVAVEDTWGAFAELQDEGLARHIGVSNFDRGLLERCLAIRHVASTQNQFSLLHQRDRRELLPWLQERGIGYLGYSPLAFGLLTGTITTETRFERGDWRGGDPPMGYYAEYFAPGVLERHLERVERLRPVADRLGVDMASVALRAAADVPGVTAVIAGSRKAHHVRENARAGEIRLDDKTLDEIDEIFWRV